ncbi:MAG: AAA family ATPase [Halanaerobiales bacterium]|nr:AAA family ATPase [Halanaerobiales bacterium]
MKLPLNISDFGLIRRENYLYVDKTRYIEELEEAGRYLFFIRPRRFGKSLFLSMLDHYYDINRSTEFEELFGDLYIGKKPTETKNSYLIWKLNFSALDTSTSDGLKESFDERILDSLILFFKHYQEIFPNKNDIIYELKSASSTRKLGILFTEVAEIGYKVYVIIDEYDHFANDIIAMGDGEFYRGIIRASGFVRDFYEALKIGTQGIIDRIFITGITPIMLDDMTSGFNITSNITMLETVNEMLGFTHREVERILDNFFEVGDREKILIELKKYYNGYSFNKKVTERLFNPNMVLYFFKEMQLTGEYPEKLIDDNVKMDYGRLNRLISNKANQHTLEAIIKEEKIVANVVSKFSFDQMYDEEYFVSLLFYLGLLTIDKKIRTRLFLKIPNFVIKTIFWETFDRKLRERYQLKLSVNELHEAIEMIAYDGELEVYFEFINNNILQVLSNRDLIQFDEKYLKMILVTYLSLANVYKISSEREVEGGYIDILLEKDIRYPDVKYEWLWELKYLKKSERNQLGRIKKEGLAQLKRYAESDKFNDKENLKKALIIFIGKDEYEILTL